MTAFGKSIRIYLADGTPTGIRHAELVNWSGQAMVCPRGRVNELRLWAESRRPGVYFLVGDDEPQGQPTVYVGHAENIVDRLKDHIQKKDFWNRVVFFTSKDDNLTKVHVKYLEGRLVQLATEAGRAQLQNGNVPQLPVLPRADCDAMEEFLGPLRILLGALGFLLLQSVTSTSDSRVSGTDEGTLVGKKLRFRLPKRGVEAAGAVSDEGFVVFAGSIGDAEERDYLAKGARKYREQLTTDGTIAQDGEKIRFTKNALFTSPSMAACVLSGASYNGRDVWKDENGSSLKILEEQMTERADSGNEEE